MTATPRWIHSIQAFVSSSGGMICPWQSGQSGQPSPESVARTMTPIVTSASVVTRVARARRWKRVTRPPFYRAGGASRPGAVRFAAMAPHRSIVALSLLALVVAACGSAGSPSASTGPSAAAVRIGLGGPLRHRRPAGIDGGLVRVRRRNRRSSRCSSRTGSRAVRRASCSRCSTRTTAPSPRPTGRSRSPSTTSPRIRRRRSRRSTARSPGRSRDERGLYILDADLPEAGTWGAEIHTQAPGGPEETIRATFEVLDSSSLVQVGDPAPATETPTLADVGGDVAKISTDATPEPAFYETSVADALAAGKPFILVFATPKFCTSAQCGPTLDRIKPIAAAHPEVTFINVEPYQLQRRRRPAPAGPRRERPAPGDRGHGRLGPVHRAVDLRRRRDGHRPRVVRPDRDRRGARGGDRRRSRLRGGSLARARPRCQSALSMPSSRRYQTADWRRGRHVLAEVTGRELDAVLAGRRGRRSRPSHRSSGGRSSGRRSATARRPRRRRPSPICASAGGPSSGATPPPRISAAPPVTAMTTTRMTAKTFRVRRSTDQAPVPLLPGAWSGVPSAHRGQVSGPGS